MKTKEIGGRSTDSPLNGKPHHLKSAGHPSTKQRQVMQQQYSAESLRSSGRGTDGGAPNFPDFYHPNNNNMSNQLHPIQEITRGGGAFGGHSREPSPDKKSHKVSRPGKKVKSSKRQTHKEVMYNRIANNNNQHSEDEKQ